MPQPLFQLLAAGSRSLLGAVRPWLVAAGLVAVPWSAAQAQSAGSWNSLGPPGGTVLSLLRPAAAPSLLYAGTSPNGVFVSADSGQTWVAANAGLSTAPGLARRVVHALAADDQHLYAATDAGIFQASAPLQAGDLPSWTLMSATGAAAPIKLLAVDPASGTLFAAGAGASMADAPVVYSMVIAPQGAPGNSWTASPLPGGTEGSIAGALTVLPGTGAAPATVVVGAGLRVFGASVQPGGLALSWFDEDPLGQVAAQGALETLAYSADLSQGLFGCSGNQLLQATDAGNLNGPNSWLANTIDPASGGTLTCSAIASGPGLLAIATNQGVFVWRGDFAASGALNIVATKALPVSAAANTLVVSTGSLIVGGAFGVSSQTAVALTSTSPWTPGNGPASVAAGGSNNRLNNGSVSDVTALGTTLYAAIAYEQYADVLVSTDGAATWTSSGLGKVLGSQVAIPALAADATHGVVYAGTELGLYALTGGRWVPVAAAAIPNVLAMERDGGILYLGTDAGVFSVRLGPTPASATATNAGLASVRVTALHAEGGKVYAGTNDTSSATSAVSVANSVSSGVPVWRDFAFGAVGTRGSRVYSLAVVGTKLLVSTRSEQVFIAEEGGAWTTASVGLSDPNGTVTSLLSDGTNVYAATGSQGVFVASLTGIGALWTPNWTPFNGGAQDSLPGLEVHQLRSNGDLLYAATNGGLAEFKGIVPIATTPVPPVTAPAADQGGGGGGSIDGGALLGLLAMLAALAGSARASRRKD